MKIQTFFQQQQIRKELNLMYDRFVDTSDVQMVRVAKNIIHQYVLSYEMNDGRFFPKYCQPQSHIAIIVAYSADQSGLLRLFLNHMHPFLISQHASYGLYLIESSTKSWNKGRLYNAGYYEAIKDFPQYECFLFHEIDALPQSNLNYYTCDRDLPVLFMSAPSQLADG